MAAKKNHLSFGVEFDGKLHHEFELRLPMIGDNVEALNIAKRDSVLDTNVALLARCLTRLGDIPKEAISYELLNSNLVDDDYDVLWGALADLKKKRLTQSPRSKTSEN